MKWIRYTIETTEEAEDTVCGILSEEGIDAVEIEDLRPVEDRVQGTFAELQPDLPEDDGRSRIHFYMKDGEDHGTQLEKIRMSLETARQWMPMGSLHITTDVTQDEDWVNNWKKFFHSFKVDDILFTPTWEQVSTDTSYSTLIRIDPGIAFGTGKHESTQLVIRQLRKYLKSGDAVLDVGFGSGILSITALKLGAGSVAGTDIDPFCTTAIRENMKANDLVYDPAAFYIGDLTQDQALQEKVGKGKYDIVVANILADILIPMASVLKETMKPNGILITSGIINFRMEDVKQALTEAGLVIEEETIQGEWGSITARRPVD